MHGTIAVDFAGSKDERKTFIETHREKFPHGLTDGGKLMCREPELQLVAKYHNSNELVQVQKAFNDLGWEIAVQAVRRWK